MMYYCITIIFETFLCRGPEQMDDKTALIMVIGYIRSILTINESQITVSADGHSISESTLLHLWG